MFLLHLLLFYLLGASVARLAPPVLSDKQARRLLQEALIYMNSDDIWYRIPPVNKHSDDDMDGLNDVIETNRAAGQITLYKLLDSPGKTERVGVINLAELLQHLEGTWRPMPDPSNYHRRLDELIITLNEQGRAQIRVIKPQILLPHDVPQNGPQTPVLQNSVPPSSANYTADHETNRCSPRIAGFWYRVKGKYPNDVVHLQLTADPIFSDVGSMPGEWQVIQVAPREVPKRLVGHWLRVPRASTKAQYRGDELRWLIEDGELVYEFVSTPRW